jgi:hypothetical protein
MGDPHGPLGQRVIRPEQVSSGQYLQGAVQSFRGGVQDRLQDRSLAHLSQHGRGLQGGPVGRGEALGALLDVGQDSAGHHRPWRHWARLATVTEDRVIARRELPGLQQAADEFLEIEWVAGGSLV